MTHSFVIEFSLLFFFYIKKCSLFFVISVSVSDLQPHSELDPDSDGSFTEAEAQVCVNELLHSMKKMHITVNDGKIKLSSILHCSGPAGRSRQS